MNGIGFGRWSAPYWFVGSEPSEWDEPERSAAWEACGGGALVDAARFEEEWNARVSADLQTQHFVRKPELQKGAWPALIHIVLGFTGSHEDASIFQRDKWGREAGKVALLELSADGDERDRSAVVRERLVSAMPQLVVLYGTAPAQGETIAGGAFDAAGMRWSGDTLCAVIRDPARPIRSFAFWREYGQGLARAVKARKLM